MVKELLLQKEMAQYLHESVARGVSVEKAQKMTKRLVCWQSSPIVCHTVTHSCSAIDAQKKVNKERAQKRKLFRKRKQPRAGGGRGRDAGKTAGCGRGRGRGRGAAGGTAAP